MRTDGYFWDSERVVTWGNSIAEYLKQYSNIYLLTELPGNIGDHLIWEGTIVFLNNHKISFKEIKKQDLDSISAIDGCLLIPGSGALTKHFNEWLPETIEVASSRFTYVVVLPSKINPEIQNVRKVLELSNVTLFAREQYSFSEAKRYGRVSLGIDLALFSRYFDEVDSNESTSNEGILVCLRTDAASKLTNGAYSLNGQINNDISITKSDLDGWMQAIKNSDSIVTDRLHVAVSAVMLNKNLFYIDADVDKISNYLKFTFGSSTPTNKVVKIDLDWLREKGYIQLKEVG